MRYNGAADPDLTPAPATRVQFLLHRVRSRSRIKASGGTVGVIRKFLGRSDDTATGSLNLFYASKENVEPQRRVAALFESLRTTETHNRLPSSRPAR